MKILIGNNGNIDFDAPIKVTKTQKQNILKFLKTIFAVVDPDETEEFRNERLGEKLFMRNWNTDEYDHLLQMEKTTDEISELLGRTWMSVNIMRGKFISQFLEYAKSQGKDPFKGARKQLIKQFLKEKEKEKLARANTRKEKRKIEKQIKELYEELDSWNSDKKKNEVEFRMKFGKLKNGTADEYVSKKQKQLIEQIKTLKRNLEKI